MAPWGALLGTLTLNYIQHRRGLPTICSVGRRVLHTEHPAGALIFLAGVGWFIDHILGATPEESHHAGTHPSP